MDDLGVPLFYETSKSASLRPTKTTNSPCLPDPKMPPVDPKWAPGRSSEASSTPGDRGTTLQFGM